MIIKLILIRLQNNTPNPGYINGVKSAVTDYFIEMKYGHLGISTKTNVVGGLGGALN